MPNTPSLKIAMPFDYLIIAKPLGQKDRDVGMENMENQQMRITEAFFSWENIR
jgi:hypothetical protein